MLISPIVCSFDCPSLPPLFAFLFASASAASLEFGRRHASLVASPLASPFALPFAVRYLGVLLCPCRPPYAASFVSM